MPRANYSYFQTDERTGSNAFLQVEFRQNEAGCVVEMLATMTFDVTIDQLEDAALHGLVLSAAETWNGQRQIHTDLMKVSKVARSGWASRALELVMENWTSEMLEHHIKSLLVLQASA